jgi:hypothetical protein
MTKPELFHWLALELRRDHLRHCGGKDCNISLSLLLEMAEAAGAQFTANERADFPGRGGDY